MNKLELKHIVGYLPYQLKGQYTNKDGDVEMIHILGFHDNGILSYEDNSKPPRRWIDWRVCRTLQKRDSYFFIENLKPILRPLTDLVKEIDGVVHAIELAKLNLKYKPLHSPFVDKDGEILFTCNLINKPFGKVVKVTNFDTWVLYLSISQPERLSMYLIDYLYSNHFDIYGLIEQNLAININTL